MAFVKPLDPRGESNRPRTPGDDAAMYAARVTRAKACRDAAALLNNEILGAYAVGLHVEIESHSIQRMGQPDDRPFIGLRITRREEF